MADQDSDASRLVSLSRQSFPLEFVGNFQNQRHGTHPIGIGTFVTIGHPPAQWKCLDGDDPHCIVYRPSRRIGIGFWKQSFVGDAPH